MIAKNKNVKLYLEQWKITENEKEIMGKTSMDNFDMMWFLDQIGVDEKYIKKEHSNDSYYSLED
jgi:hypothetical protein